MPQSFTHRLICEGEHIDRGVCLSGMVYLSTLPPPVIEVKIVSVSVFLDLHS